MTQHVALDLDDSPRMAGIAQNCSDKGEMGDTEGEMLLCLHPIFCPPRLEAKGLGLNPGCAIYQ